MDAYSLKDLEKPISQMVRSKADCMSVEILTDTIHICLHACYVAKFNYTVPGTVSDFSEECNISTTNYPATSVTTSPTTTTTESSLPANKNSSVFEAGSVLFFVVVGLGVLVVLVILIFAILVVCCIVSRKIRAHTNKTAPLQGKSYGGGEGLPQHMDQKPQSQGMLCQMI